MKNHYATPPNHTAYNPSILGDVLTIICDSILLIAVCAGVLAYWSVML